jgi:hypothetical protein
MPPFPFRRRQPKLGAWRLPNLEGLCGRHVSHHAPTSTSSHAPSDLLSLPFLEYDKVLSYLYVLARAVSCAPLSRCLLLSYGNCHLNTRCLPSQPAATLHWHLLHQTICPSTFISFGLCTSLDVFGVSSCLQTWPRPNIYEAIEVAPCLSPILNPATVAATAGAPTCPMGRGAVRLGLAATKRTCLQHQESGVC